MTQSLDYGEILTALEQASAFELFRLKRAIDLALDDPQPVAPVMAALRPGMATRFFDWTSNSEKTCTIVRSKRNSVTIRQHDDGQLYNEHYYMLNIDGADTSIRQLLTEGLVSTRAYGGL